MASILCLARADKNILHSDKLPSFGQIEPHLEIFEQLVDTIAADREKIIFLCYTLLNRNSQFVKSLGFLPIFSISYENFSGKNSYSAFSSSVNSE